MTLWDYVRYGANDFIGEVVIDLAHHSLDDEADWYKLQPHQDTSYLVCALDYLYLLFSLSLFLYFTPIMLTILSIQKYQLFVKEMFFNVIIAKQAAFYTCFWGKLEKTKNPFFPTANQVNVNFPFCVAQLKRKSPECGFEK